MAGGWCRVWTLTEKPCSVVSCNKTIFNTLARGQQATGVGFNMLNLLWLDIRLVHTLDIGYLDFCDPHM